MRTALLLLAVSAAIWPASASGFGSDHPIDDRRTREALRLAYEFWGASPSCGRPRVYMAELGGTEGANGAAVIPGVCVIWVDPSTYYEPLDIADWNDERTTYCTLIAHEVGHLLGYGHAWWPRSVMHPLEVGNYPTRPCLRRFDRRLYRDAKRDIGTFAFRYSPGLR